MDDKVLVSAKLGSLILEVSEAVVQAGLHQDPVFNGVQPWLSALKERIVTLWKVIESTAESNLPDDMQPTDLDAVLHLPICVIAMCDKFMAMAPGCSGTVLLQEQEQKRSTAHKGSEMAIHGLGVIIDTAIEGLDVAIATFGGYLADSVCSGLDLNTEEADPNVSMEDWVTVGHQEACEDASATETPIVEPEKGDGTSDHEDLESIPKPLKEDDMASLEHQTAESHADSPFEDAAPVAESHEAIPIVGHSQHKDVEMSANEKQFWKSIDDGDVVAVRNALEKGGNNLPPRDYIWGPNPAPTRSTDSNNESGMAANVPLHRAAKLGHVDVLEALLDHGAFADKIDENGEAALHYAAWFGQLACVEVLVRRGGAAVDVTCGSVFDAATPLDWAARNGHLDVATFLLDEGGASPLGVEPTEYPPIIMAATNGHEDVVSLLLARGADPKAPRGKNSRTALHAAAQGGFENVVRLLLEFGAEVDKAAYVDGGGSDEEEEECGRAKLTPLHVAALEGHAGVAWLLLTRGADASRVASTKKGMDDDDDDAKVGGGGDGIWTWTPADLAREDQKLSSLLEDWTRLRDRFRSLAADAKQTVQP